MQNCSSPILAFSTRVGPPAALEALWSNTVPLIMLLSSTVPPSLQTTLMSLRSRLHQKSLLSLPLYIISLQDWNIFPETALPACAACILLLAE